MTPIRPVIMVVLFGLTMLIVAGGLTLSPDNIAALLMCMAAVDISGKEEQHA